MRCTVSVISRARAEQSAAGISKRRRDSNIVITSSIRMPSTSHCRAEATSTFAGGGGNPTTQIQSLYDNILEHLEWIAADPNSPAVQHWRAEIENWTKQILNKAGKRPGSVDKYLQRIMASREVIWKTCFPLRSSLSIPADQLHDKVVITIHPFVAPLWDEFG